MATVSELGDGSALTIEWLNSLARALGTVEDKVNTMDSVIISTSGAGSNPSPIPDLDSTSTYRIHVGVTTVTFAAAKGTKSGIEFGTTFGDKNVFVVANIRNSNAITIQVTATNVGTFAISYNNHTGKEVKDATVQFVAIGKK